MKASEEEETNTKVLYAPIQFYDACDECDTLPEDRWEELRHKLVEEEKTITEGRERVGFLREFVVDLIEYFFVRLRASPNEVQVVYSPSEMF